MNVKEFLLITMLISGCAVKKTSISEKPSYSGIYPHLAYYNNEGESGTGAVVPWADRLWVMTYGPHLPHGSSDKLYEVTPDLRQIVRQESVGGTPANRLIHKESQQLFIGPYVIDKERNVRVIPYKDAPGRYTGTARHLSSPAEKVYIATMEEGFYEIGVRDLAVNTLYKDGNILKENQKNPREFSSLLPGAHGKGAYSGQGVLVYSNNGEGSLEAQKKIDIEAGALAEWDGANWKVIRRNQFVEVTGPGGLYGNADPENDPIWATGWDHKSVLLGARDAQSGWSFYRLPKASHSYDGAHGWNTEWPRIRDVGTPDTSDYLMTMHGMFWKFPQLFSVNRSAGIRPRSAYLKVIGDFTRWQNRLVFGTDDSAQKEFLNTRKIKGNIGGPGQSNSNLWFTSPRLPDNLGPNTAGGAIWLSEKIKANAPSDPFLFAGWGHRMAWVLNESSENASFIFEVDKDGTNTWEMMKEITATPGRAVSVVFDRLEEGEWIRAKSNRDIKATIHFTYTDRSRFPENEDLIFQGLKATSKDEPFNAGLLYGLGDNRRALGILSGQIQDGKFVENGYYELGEEMNLVKKDDPKTAKYIREKFVIPSDVITVEESSVLIVDDSRRRWRLPLGDPAYTQYTQNNLLRISREVATERDLLNVHGTFYELPAENADGFAKIRPISSHNKVIYDYASYRGLLVMTGIEDEGSNNEHIIASQDGLAKLWVGAIDDLWKLGKPRGHGGPWKNSAVRKNIPSDPYLIGFYDEKRLELSHDHPRPVRFTLEVEPVGHGPWMVYKEIVVKPGETVNHLFLQSFQSRWIRFTSNQDCRATAYLRYN